MWHNCTLLCWIPHCNLQNILPQGNLKSSLKLTRLAGFRNLHNTNEIRAVAPSSKPLPKHSILHELNHIQHLLPLPIPQTKHQSLSAIYRLSTLLQLKELSLSSIYSSGSYDHQLHDPPNHSPSHTALQNSCSPNSLVFLSPLSSNVPDFH